MAVKRSRRHLVAVNRAIVSAGLDERGLDAPMVELLRDLARQMDAASGDGPSARLLAAYLSATKDLKRAAERVAVARRRAEREAPAGVPADGERKLEAVKGTALDEFLRKQRVG